LYRKQLERLALAQLKGRSRNPEHKVLPLTQSDAMHADGVLHAFNEMRQQFVSLGYGIPPELAAKPHRMDL
jgi:hypothetical protein